MDFVETMSLKERWTMWKVVGLTLGLTKEKTLEYFSNTWRWQFYEKPTPYMEEIRTLYKKLAKIMNGKDALNVAVD
jgi:hypothetical protein